MNFAQTVFIVDDEPAVAKALSRLLRASGYAVQTFNSAEEFLEFYTAEPGCLVLDMAMPGMTGLDLMTCLMERGFALPILFLTGSADIPEETRRMMQEGSLAIFTKPVNGDVLIRGVEAALALDRKSRTG